jgi:ubiquinone/menaquinone biosynthesis C-methylase UbiE
MEYYNTIAPGYEELHEKEQLKKLNLISQYIKPEPNDRLLDVGCGTGISTRFWKCKRAGIDPAQQAVRIAQKRDPDGNYLIASAENIPFPDKSFDLVISITAVHNFKNPEKGLSEIKRVAKGRVVLSVLKKSARFSQIKSLIKKLFAIEKELEEDKDIIFIGKI